MSICQENLTPFSLRHHFILSPQAERAMTRLAQVHGDTIRTGSSKGLVIQGPSGVGKSTLIQEYVRELESSKKTDQGQRSVLIVEIPSSPTKKNLAAAMLTAMNDRYADSRSHSAETKFARIIQLLKNLSVEVVVLDEAQHLVDYMRNNAYEAADWIKSLMNETGIAFVLVGLKRTENLLLANEQLRRRFSATVDYGRFMLTEESWKQFAMLLKAIHELLPVCSISFSGRDIILRFYLASFGLIDYLIKVLDRAVWLVEDLNLEGIDLALLAQSFRDEVWSYAPEERNPFSSTFDFQPLIGTREPFENFDTIAA
ncbi:TniB family NTP-binding protein [Pseudomonas kielensis]|uniref:TniB family NTP-binding protein n=1 Tax=Pseudomonas kielensis TaxID=2762577 RepID=UPI00223F9A8B|nr:TniB family NTP-binding protein [Pseudomonas kielensis]UZM13103.1 TniB family NTP-binding protein [Pseudomonas kielensis]